MGVPIKKGIVDRTALHDWWTERSIPASRSGIRSFKWIDFEKLSDVRELILETFADEGASDYIDKARIKAICDTTQKTYKRFI